MSIEKITAKIISDAEGEALVIRKENQQQCDAVRREAEEKARQIAENARKDGEKEKEKLILRSKAAADIDGRKLILQEKQRLIAECFAQAETQIRAMDRESYVEFLLRLLKDTGQTDGELILNPSDAEEIGEALICAAQAEIPGCRIVLSGQTREIRGGFLLKQGAVYLNATLEALMEEAKEQMTAETAERLFR